MYNQLSKMMFNKMSGGAQGNVANWGMLFVLSLIVLALKGVVVMWSWNAVMPTVLESTGNTRGFVRPISWMDGVLLVILFNTLF